MGLMASFAIGGGWLMNLFLLHLCLQVLMTGEAEVRTLRQKEIAQLCLVRAVALRTFTGHDRRMFAFPGHQSLIQVFVAGKTKRPLFAHDHSRHVRRMGIMACETLPVRKRGMVRATRLRFHEIPVTLGAQLRAAVSQQILLIRPMGAMAGITGPVQDGLMRIGL